jgi:DNA-binding transcriptional LysR family regulator
MKAKSPYEVLDLKALRCFYFVAKTGSVTRAALELGIAGPAVTQRVQKLEEDLGEKLYESRGGRVRLTRAGEYALSFASNLFDEIENFERTLKEQEESSEIIVSAHDAILGYLFADVVEKFKRSHPLAKLNLRVRRIDDTVREVRMNEADVGIIPARQLPEELFSRQIGTWRACLLTAKGHPVARSGRADFQSLLNEEMMRRYPLIVLEEQLGGGVFTETFGRLNLTPNIGMEVGSLDTLKRFVARGIGVGVVPELWLTDEDRLRMEVILVPPELKADSTYVFVMRRDKHKGRLLKDLLDLLGQISPARKN